MPPPGATPVLAGGPSTLSAMSSSSTETLARIFANLKSREEPVRISAARDLAVHVAFVTSELKGDNLSSFNSELNRLIFGLTHSPHAHEKLGGISAIENLIELESEDNSARLYRFYQYLKPNLPCNDATVMIAASRALGRVCKHGAQSLGDQFMEFEVLRALDFLQGDKDRNESGRYAAVLIIKELAYNVPHLFHIYVNRVLDRIWVALRDSKVLVREGAAEALGNCLEITSKREKQMGVQAYEHIYEEAEKGLKTTTVEWIHGSLLAVQQLLMHSKTVSATGSR
jgi:FKBP12-rapamycin complex-associated protein